MSEEPRSHCWPSYGPEFLGDCSILSIKRDGSFSSIATATKLVNATLARNQDIVDRVAAGLDADAWATAVFDFKTGIEAYRPHPGAEPALRDTYGVGVVIVHDPDARNGYRVHTAYPRND